MCDRGNRGQLHFNNTVGENNSNNDTDTINKKRLPHFKVSFQLLIPGIFAIEILFQKNQNIVMLTLGCKT